MDSVVIGAKLKKFRKQQGYTTTTLGEKIGVSQAQISRLENGKQGFRSITLARLAKALKVAPVYFFLEEKDKGEALIAERLASYGVTPSKRLLAAMSSAQFRSVAERASKLLEESPARFKAAAKAFNAKAR